MRPQHATQKGALAMLTIRILLATVVLLAGSLSLATAKDAKDVTGAAAQADLDILLNTLRANRKALVAVNLNLTDDEAVKFWPIFDRYHAEMNTVGDRLVKVIEEYTSNFATLSDEQATKVVEDYLAIETDRAKVRRTYVEEFAKALPGRKLARFYQIENKMDAVLRYDLASTIPVIEEETAK
jgi:hypothetical protein